MPVEATFEPDPRTAWRDVGGSIVVVNCASQRMVVWNESAGMLWEKVAERCTRLVLIDALAGAYGLGESEASRDVDQFLADTGNNGLLTGVSPHPFPHDDNGVDVHGEELLRDLEIASIRSITPFAVTVETTCTCNEDCVHCFMERTGRGLSSAEMTSLFDALADAGCLFLTFTGGEFFTRRDAWALLARANERAFAIDILTNGTLLTRQDAQTLGTMRIRRVQVSVYAADPGTHDAITRRPGSHRKTLAAIRALREENVRVEISFPLMSPNLREWRGVAALAGELDCGLLVSKVITPKNDGGRDPISLRLTDTEIAEALSDTELARYIRSRPSFEDHIALLALPRIQDAAPCYSGFNTCAIRPNGDVVPCNQLLLAVGNVREQPFGKIWRESPVLLRLRALRVEDLHTCRSCPLLSRCSRCPGLALLEGGDLFGCSPEHRRIATIEQALAH
jgi:radical SAM protein with 4Fe4S-binding SPASM domain